jgi:hypothetical protein
MIKTIPYSTTITCDCCGTELLQEEKRGFGFTKKKRYIRFNCYSKMVLCSEWGGREYHLCPACEVEIFGGIKKRKKELEDKEK